jgi:uridine phosphorylase
MPEYPAAANYEVLLALIEAAENLGIQNYHVGVTATTSDFYAGQDRPAAQNTAKSMENSLLTLQEARVLDFDMETATLYTLAGVYGLRSGAVCAVYANRCTNEVSPGKGEDNAIRTANEAVKILSEWDRLKRKNGKR